MFGNTQSGRRLDSFGPYRSLQVGEKAGEGSWQDKRLSASQRGIRSKRLFTYTIPHFSHLHLTDHHRHQLQPFDLSYLQWKPMYSIYPSWGRPAFRWPLCLSRSSAHGSQLSYVYSYRSHFRCSVLFCSVAKRTFCSAISIKFMTD